MNIPGLGSCSLDPVYECLASEPISLSVLGGKQCRILVEGYEEDEEKREIEVAIANFLAATGEILNAASPHAFQYYLDVKASHSPQEDDFPAISAVEDIWRYVQFGTEAIVSRRSRGDKGIYISLECNCDWEPEHGLQIIFRSGAVVSKIGPYDGHLTNADAYADSSLENVIYR